MELTEAEIQTKNPTELLRDQVRLLNEANQSLAEIQKTQQLLLEGISRLNETGRPATDVEPEVVVSDFHMSFLSMVGFIIKWMIASIPALIIIGLVSALVWAILTGYLSTLFR